MLSSTGVKGKPKGHGASDINPDVLDLSSGVLDLRECQLLEVQQKHQKPRWFMVIWCYMGHEILLVYQWITKIEIHLIINYQLITENLVGLPIKYLFNWSWHWSTYSRSRCSGWPSPKSTIIDIFRVEIMDPRPTARRLVSAWWLTYPSEKYTFVSWDDDIPNIFNILRKMIQMFQTTNQLWFQLLVSVSVFLFHLNTSGFISFISHTNTAARRPGGWISTLPAHDCCLTELPEYRRSLAYWP